MILEIVLGQWLGRHLARALDVVSDRQGAVTQWRAMIRAIEDEAFESPLPVRLRAAFTASGRPASEEIASLERIVGFADARRNEAFRFVFGGLLFWDVHCGLALLRWRARAGHRLGRWLETLGEVDALASLAAFAFEHPDYAWPVLEAEPMLDARGLGHPLIADDRRVGNDVHLPSGGRALVVTGSNMSGKSTLLRAMGANAILAMAGAPACATSLRIGPVRVATSMRIDDSLEEGVSHFYAELRRLKRVVDLAGHGARPGAAVLFLLDEILHGTNSRERIIGACAVVRDLVARGALGAVSTHDLGITALERQLEGRRECSLRGAGRWRRDDLRLRAPAGDRPELERAAPHARGGPRRARRRGGSGVTVTGAITPRRRRTRRPRGCRSCRTRGRRGGRRRARCPARRGHQRERLHEALVHRIDGGPLRATLVLIAHETPALLDRIDQLAEAVAELEPRDVELEPLGEGRVAGLRARQRGLGGGVVGTRKIATIDPRRSPASTWSTSARKYASSEVAAASSVC